MTPARWRDVGRLFDAASTLEGAARAALLDGRREDDPDLVEEVESLLAADEGAAGLLDQGAVGLVADELEGDEEPRSVEGVRLGAYRLTSEIGRGGMSRVYLAERVGDHLRRQVAIKILSTPDRQREERLRRFHAEGRMLASLSHPQIAQVFDAGVDAVGDPYLVMEYVDGEPITAWCARRDLAVADLIGLFLDVCAAVQHAHQHLIVHRDLKPSNILVDREGRVRLLDFGIAKLLDPERHGLAEQIPPTRVGLLPMTPEYAAPEQLVGGPITTSTDVYGLGLLLYELLTGRRPFDLEGCPASEIERIIRESEPPRPSEVTKRRRSETAPARRGSPRRVARSGAPGSDLDAVVLRALAKEPERRYGAVQELAEDLRRFLDGQPVSARPATVAYRLGKVVRRHRPVVATAVGVVLLLAGVTGYHTARLKVERDQARREARRAEEVTGLLRDVFADADPRRTESGPATVDELLDRGAERVRQLETQPLIQAELFHFLALAYYGQGSIAEAEALFEAALELHRRHLEPPDLKLVRSLNHLGWLRLTERDLAGASALFTEALAAHRGGPVGETEELANSLRGLALAHSGQGDHATAESLLHRAIGILVEVRGPDHVFVADALQDLGIVLRDRGAHREARSAFEESLEIRRRRLGADHPAVASSLHQLALLAEDAGEPRAAAAHLTRALAIRRRALGDDHPGSLELVDALAELEAASRPSRPRPPPTGSAADG